MLIAGGYDKGVDLRSMAADVDGIDAVIAVGDTAPAVAEVFAAVPEVIVARDLVEAVDVRLDDRPTRVDGAAVARLRQLRPVHRVRSPRRPLPVARARALRRIRRHTNDQSTIVTNHGGHR